MAGSVTQICPQESLSPFLCLAFLCVGLIVGEPVPSWQQDGPSIPGLHSISLGTLWERKHPFWAHIVLQQKWEEFSLADLRSHATFFYPILRATGDSVFSLARRESHGHSWPAGFHQPLRKQQSFSLAQLRSYNHPWPHPCGQGISVFWLASLGSCGHRSPLGFISPSRSSRPESGMWSPEKEGMDVGQAKPIALHCRTLE